MDNFIDYYHYNLLVYYFGVMATILEIYDEMYKFMTSICIVKLMRQFIIKMVYKKMKKYSSQLKELNC